MTQSSKIHFAGYAGLFDIPDADKDIIRQGAFYETLANRTTALPLLWQHNPEQRIGTILGINEDPKGLRVIAQIDDPNCRAAVMLSNGSVDGLSFGYRARDARVFENNRELLAIDLFEVSLVTHPLQYSARVHLVART